MKKIRTSFITLLCVVMTMTILISCSTQTTSPDSSEGYQKITPEQAKERMDSDKSVIILDVRTEDEFREKHIEGAILIPNETILDQKPNLLPDLNAEILIYCRSGNRSRQAAEKLLSIGYTNVYDFGGIIDWPYATVSDE